jgi:hypothetical protein
MSVNKKTALRWFLCVFVVFFEWVFYSQPWFADLGVLYYNDFADFRTKHFPNVLPQHGNSTGTLFFLNYFSGTAANWAAASALHQPISCWWWVTASSANNTAQGGDSTSSSGWLFPLQEDHQQSCHSTPGNKAVFVIQLNCQCCG